jgi:hypothetical protein
VYRLSGLLNGYRIGGASRSLLPIRAALTEIFRVGEMEGGCKKHATRLFGRSPTVRSNCTTFEPIAAYVSRIRIIARRAKERSVRLKVAPGKHHHKLRIASILFSDPTCLPFLAISHISVSPSQCSASGTLPARPRGPLLASLQERSVRNRAFSDQSLLCQHGHSQHRVSQLLSTSPRSGDRTQMVRYAIT